MPIKPTDWGAITRDYNQRLKDLKYRLDNEYFYDEENNAWTDPDLQAQYDALLAERDALPAKIAAENKLIEEERRKAEYEANVLAEDTRIQEQSQSRNRMANDTLARMNQQQTASDAQTTASRQGAAGSAGRGVGPAYDLQKQREAGQQKVGAAMSAAPSVSAFGGKAAAVSPVNATSQTANTGVIQPLNKSFELSQIVAQRANRDQAATGEFSKDRSKAQNVGMANSFTPPNTQGVQIGEMPINKFGGE